MREYHELNLLLEEKISKTPRTLRDKELIDEIIRQWLERKAQVLTESFGLQKAKWSLRNALGLEQKEDPEIFKKLEESDHEIWKQEKPSPVAERVWPCQHVRIADGKYYHTNLTADSRIYIDNLGNWNVCPVEGCGAKRPAEKPRTLAERLAEAGRKYAVENGFVLPTIKIKSEDEFFGAIANEARMWLREKIEKHADKIYGVCDTDVLLREIEL